MDIFLCNNRAFILYGPYHCRLSLQCISPLLQVIESLPPLYLDLSNCRQGQELDQELAGLEFTAAGKTHKSEEFLWALLKNRQVDRQVDRQVERQVEALPDDFAVL